MYWFHYDFDVCWYHKYPGSPVDQTKWLVFEMIHVNDSRSYQWAKFGLWTPWVNIMHNEDLQQTSSAATKFINACHRSRAIWTSLAAAECASSVQVKHLWLWSDPSSVENWVANGFIWMVNSGFTKNDESRSGSWVRERSSYFQS